ncbi:SAM-dependent methyltransferase [Aliiroseovarius sp. Z3]|uniref:methyltransferase domain-containing protein n=1 Tax=Aliiroseovarius sp. Z3 TaxID=2811402 RepID=UPI0023B292AA|nr:methyltransferase domain-containing protein [Aliiroseovarius sp. Z3]MDE9450178.1 SAM-dependent methyltransferase [Aliiroseovarius sp. Z3]
MTQTDPDLPPRLTDRAQLDRNRKRATPDGLFLQNLAADEVKDRLTEVNRRFTKPAIVTGFPEIWARSFPSAKIVADDDTLDLAPGAHDLVIHGLSLHWANDPVGQLIQARRALEPDGLFMGVMFGGQTLSELRAVLSEVEIETTGGLSPRILPMGEIRDLGALLQRAGFALPVADSDLREVTYKNATALIRDLRLMGERNALEQRLKKQLSRSVLSAVNDRYRRHFPASDGRISASFDLVFLTGWAPDDSQPKPLRPGSAVARLADALGADETKLSD